MNMEIEVTIYHFDEDHSVILYPANYAPNGRVYYHTKIDGKLFSLEYDNNGNWSAKQLSPEFCQKIGKEIERHGLI